MAGSFVCIYAHIVFSTKGRAPLLSEDIRACVWEYSGGILRNHGCVPIKIGGMADHVHVLVELAKDRTAPDVVRDLKSNSSRWIRSTFEGLSQFGWQQGYVAFSVGVNGLERVSGYIAHQEEHHREKGFQEEFLDFLRRHGAKCDERYIWA